MVVLLLGLPVLAAPENGQLPNVKILATGGTIAGAGVSSTQTAGYRAAVAPVDALINNVPELKKVANVSGEQISQIASENMTNEIWLKLGKRVNELLASPDVDGVVITHGTDTLEETAYFLNLVVKSDKPVVVVGAMRPGTSISADGPMNLYRAVVLAGSKEAVGKGVLVMLNDQINGARDVTKTNTSDTDTFKAPELGLLGYIQNETVSFYRQSTRKHTASSEFNIMGLQELPRVDIVYGYANNTRVMMDALINDGVKGIVHAGTGNGSFNANVKPAVEEALKKGIVIVRSARVGNGIITRGGEFDDDKYNTVVSDTLNSQKARVLLMLALTKTNNPREIQRMFW
ncbi:MAG TPA: type II asparaginase, partial [Patescibacteria group bacterium]|nr:type II asparaginase [Patescibacteria group bacterium]